MESIWGFYYTDIYCLALRAGYNANSPRTIGVYVRPSSYDQLFHITGDGFGRS